MTARLVQYVHVEHPRSEPSYAFLLVDRGLMGGKLDEVRLSPDQLLRLAESALHTHGIITGRR